MESHVSERCFGRLQNKIITRLGQLASTHYPAIGRKRHVFFSLPDKGDAGGKFEALSSVCQIVNERLMNCVQPVQKKLSRAHAFHATVFKSSLESHHAVLEYLKNQNI
jgi:hypothetical protein